MESINISRMIQEYFLDFKRNFKKIPWQCLSVIFVYPIYLGSFDFSLFSFCTIPCVFCVLSAGTHLQLFPNMFYLLPMTGKQREQYGKRAMAIRVLIPGTLVLLWATFFAGLCGVSAGSAAAIAVSYPLGCFLMHAAAVTEKKQENSMMFGFGQVVMMALSILGTEIGENPWVLAADVFIFLFAIVFAVKMWKRFSLQCGRQRNFDGFKREMTGA